MTVEQQLQALREELEAMKARERARTARPRFSAVTALAVAFLLGLTLSCAGRAYAVGQVPNRSLMVLEAPAPPAGVPFAESPHVTLPVQNAPVVVVGSNLTGPGEGTGVAHLTEHSNGVLTYACVNASGAPDTVWRGRLDPSIGGSVACLSSGNNDVLLSVTVPVNGRRTLYILSLADTPVQITVEMIW